LRLPADRRRPLRRRDRRVRNCGDEHADSDDASGAFHLSHPRLVWLQDHRNGDTTLLRSGGMINPGIADMV